MINHPLDELMQKQFPTVIAPKFGSPLAPLAVNGERFILCGDAIKMEIRRPWVHAVVPVSGAPFFRKLPYGPGPDYKVKLLCGPLPTEMLERFASESVAALPNEHAAWITWREDSKEFFYRSLHVKSHSPSHIDYDRPALDAGEWLVVDIHSHGRERAFFSLRDEGDDFGELRVSMVLGHVDRPVRSYATLARCLGVSMGEHLIEMQSEEVGHAA